MSYHITRFVLGLDGLSPAEKSVLHCLAYYAHEDGTNTWPSMTRIAKEAGLSDRRSAQRIVRRMEQRGILIAETKKTGGWKIPTMYRFNLEYRDRGVAPVRTKGDRGVAGAVCVTLEKNGDPDDIETATLEPQIAERGDPGDTKQRPVGRTKGYEPEEREPLERKVSAIPPPERDAADAAKPQPMTDREFEERKTLLRRQAEQLKGHTATDPSQSIGTAA